MYTEKKYIIGLRHGKLRHYTFPFSLHHDSFAYDNGYRLRDIIETGLIIERRIIILSCVNNNHIERRGYLRQIPRTSLLAREVSSVYEYKAYKYNGGG